MPRARLSFRPGDPTVNPRLQVVGVDVYELDGVRHLPIADRHVYPRELHGLLERIVSLRRPDPARKAPAELVHAMLGTAPLVSRPIARVHERLPDRQRAPARLQK